MALITDIPLCPLCGVDRLHIAIQRKPLQSFPMPSSVKLLLRLCYSYMRWVTLKYGFAASKIVGETEPNGDFHSLELKGAFVSESDAWHEVNTEAGCVKAIPFNSSFPDKTCSFGPEHWPALDGKSRRRYQERKLRTIALDVTQFEALGERIEEVANCAEGLCARD